MSFFFIGRGFVLKIHDQMTSRFRHSQNVTLGTVKKDTLCMDANEKMVAVGGVVSQKVRGDKARRRTEYSLCVLSPLGAKPGQPKAGVDVCSERGNYGSEKGHVRGGVRIQQVL